MFGRQQRALRGRALLWLRNIKLIILQQRQHRFELIGRQLVQGGLAILLANKIAGRLAVIALSQQLRQLGDHLPGGVVLLGGVQALVEVLLRSREVARQHGRITL